MDNRFLVILGAMAAAVPVLMFFGRVFNWINTTIANNRINRKFVHDMATNHLPHIYDALKLLAQERGVELPDPPPIRFIELNGHAKYRPEEDDAT